MSKFLSRKFIVAVGSALGAVLVNVGLPQEVADTVTQALVTIASFYLMGQGAVDAVAAIKSKPTAE